MIFVQERLEPVNFNASVRSLGNAFLARKGGVAPTSSEWKANRYWGNCLADLRSEYSAICAYTASWIAIDAGHAIGTVDHYIPKDEAPELAYEWSNYRFCNPRVNTNKDNKLDVMDPFKILDGWFTIDFTTFRVVPADGLPSYLEDAVNATITRLKLNLDDRLVQARVDRIQEYVDGLITFAYLQSKYPFIAMELDRQGLIENIKAMHPTSP